MKSIHFPLLEKTSPLTLPIIILILILSLVFFNSCSDNTINPNELLKDPRDLTWTSDTIAYEGSMQTFLTSMWVYSPTDAWVAGHNERSFGEIYHFDGNKWTENEPMRSGVPISTKSINQIMGLTPNNLWMVGDRRGFTRKELILNWNGSTWKEHVLNIQLRPICLFTNRANDIWVGCDSAVVYHYNGTKWERDKPKLNILPASTYFINGIIVKDTNTYLNVYVNDTVGKRYLFYFVNGNFKNWVVLDSMEIKDPQSVIKWGNWGISMGNEGGIYSFGDFGVWQYINNEWVHILPINYTMHSIYEFKKNYKIAVGVYGMVWYYDGFTWQQLKNFFSPEGSIHMTDVWTNGKEVFILGYTSWPQKTIIWRGK
jgi:hypothetical protein